MDEIVALAIGIAASPFAILPAVLLLFTERPRSTAFTFLATWFMSVALIATFFAAAAGVISASDESAVWLSWLRIAAGVAIITIAVHKWITRSATLEVPGWMDTIQRATPRSAFGLALVLSMANPKVLLLAIAAGIDIGGAEWSIHQQALAIGAFAALASISVATPVLAYAIAGPRVLGPFTHVRDWLLRNNVAVMVVVFFALGILLIFNGIEGL
jgi:threonine/homoserine/homoserine lactone efflux protein